jgi:hypothetical protein
VPIVLRQGRLRPKPAGPSSPPVEPQRPKQQDIEFVAYADDCEVRGYMHLDADRLTDSLNDHSELQVSDALLVSLGDNHGHALHQVSIGRDELIAVCARGPRGDAGRRRRTRPWPVEIRSGPYRIRGYLHAPPTVDAFANLRRRSAMVPLTDASIEYGTGAGRRRSSMGTLIVNRDRIEYIRRAVDEEVELPLVPPNPVRGVLVKDFTEHVLGG